LETIYQVNNLKVHYPIEKGFAKKVVGYIRAVNGITFNVYQRETLGLVGESGCGKSTTANCLIRLFKPTSGGILYNKKDGQQVDLATLSDRQLRFYRKEAQMIFQDPYSSLNPRMTIREVVGEPLLVNHIAKGGEITERVGSILRRVGLRPEYMKRYPHAFSGGQRQRIAIARALIVEPRVVVCDEPVSSLDVSVQAQIIELLKDLQTEFGNTYLFISHDLSVVRYISDRIIVMYLGQIVEMCDSDELFSNPLHPYTRALIDAVPDIDPKKKTVVPIMGEPGDPSMEYTGCTFYSRCKHATDVCAAQPPQLVDFPSNGKEHFVSCHHAQDWR
jgi:peptide/nickel transport system ATP-binding protein